MGSESSCRLADRCLAPPQPAGPEPGRAVRPELRTLGGPGQVSTPQVAALPSHSLMWGQEDSRRQPQAPRACPSRESGAPCRGPRPCPAALPPGGGTAPPWAHAMRICPSGALEVQAAPAGRRPTTSGLVRSAARGPHPSDHITRATREMLRPEPAQRKVSRHRTFPGPGHQHT